jgi:membrane dipeptidase
MRPLAFDSHLDLSFNALAYDRDQTLTIAELRAAEAAMPEWDRKLITVSLPELRKAGFAVCLATVLARGTAKLTHKSCPPKTALEHGYPTAAYAVARGQAAYYNKLEKQGQLRMIRDARTLKEHWNLWLASDEKKQLELPVGYILSMEGCDPMVTPDDAQEWWDLGLRTASLAHYGPSSYAHGTGPDGPLTEAGRRLIQEFNRLGMILDLTHTNDTSWYQAYDLFHGRIFASHNNCRALVPGDRQFTDDQIRKMIARQGVIGVVCDAWMLYPQYEPGKTDRKNISLENLADHIDHICQLAGNRKHVAIGSDLDGGFSANQCPHDLDTIADLRKLSDILARRGFNDEDIKAFFGGNWLEFFSQALPA